LYILIRKLRNLQKVESINLVSEKFKERLLVSATLTKLQLA